MFQSPRKSLSFRLIACTINLCFIASFLNPVRSYAQTPADLGLPKPGTMVNLTSAYVPVIAKGLRVHPENPILFDMIVDSGNSNLTTNDQQLKSESEKIIKYFLAALTIPDDDQWVNLSPYEKDRIINDQLGLTDMGRDMLAQDYILKQLTASLINPEKSLGKEFWNKVYTKAQQLYGTNDVPVNTFNKVWIVADKANIYVHDNTAFVTSSHLKVMLEEDYLSLAKHGGVGAGHAQPVLGKDVHTLGSQIVREIVLPELEKEVNQGKNFANLRQIFHSMVLAAWYKKNLKEALLNQVYSDKAKIKGVDVDDPTIKEQIYQEYLKAYKKGVFNFIKEDVVNGQATPRKYFSGGVKVNAAAAMNVVNAAQATEDLKANPSEHLFRAEFSTPGTNASGSSSAAMRGLIPLLAVAIGASLFVDGIQGVFQAETRKKEHMALDISDQLANGLIGMNPSLDFNQLSQKQFSLLINTTPEAMNRLLSTIYLVHQDEILEGVSGVDLQRLPETVLANVLKQLRDGFKKGQVTPKNLVPEAIRLLKVEFHPSAAMVTREEILHAFRLQNKDLSDAQVKAIQALVLNPRNVNFVSLRQVLGDPGPEEISFKLNRVLNGEDGLKAVLLNANLSYRTTEGEKLTRATRMIPLGTENSYRMAIYRKSQEQEGYYLAGVIKFEKVEDGKAVVGSHGFMTAMREADKPLLLEALYLLLKTYDIHELELSTEDPQHSVLDRAEWHKRGFKIEGKSSPYYIMPEGPAETAAKRSVIKINARLQVLHELIIKVQARLAQATSMEMNYHAHSLEGATSENPFEVQQELEVFLTEEKDLQKLLATFEKKDETKAAVAAAAMTAEEKAALRAFLDEHKDDLETGYAADALIKADADTPAKRKAIEEKFGDKYDVFFAPHPIILTEDKIADWYEDFKSIKAKSKRKLDDILEVKGNVKKPSYLIIFKEKKGESPVRKPINFNNLNDVKKAIRLFMGVIPNSSLNMIHVADSRDSVVREIGILNDALAENAKDIASTRVWHPLEKNNEDGKPANTDFKLAKGETVVLRLNTEGSLYTVENVNDKINVYRGAGEGKRLIVDDQSGQPIRAVSDLAGHWAFTISKEEGFFIRPITGREISYSYSAAMRSPESIEQDIQRIRSKIRDEEANNSFTRATGPNYTLDFLRERLNELEIELDQTGVNAAMATDGSKKPTTIYKEFGPAISIPNGDGSSITLEINPRTQRLLVNNQTPSRWVIKYQRGTVPVEADFWPNHNSHDVMFERELPGQRGNDSLRFPDGEFTVKKLDGGKLKLKKEGAILYVEESAAAMSVDFSELIQPANESTESKKMVYIKRMLSGEKNTAEFAHTISRILGVGLTGGLIFNPNSEVTQNNDPLRMIKALPENGTFLTKDGFVNLSKAEELLSSREFMLFKFVTTFANSRVGDQAPSLYLLYNPSAAMVTKEININGRKIVIKSKQTAEGTKHQISSLDIPSQTPRLPGGTLNEAGNHVNDQAEEILERYISSKADGSLRRAFDEIVPFTLEAQKERIAAYRLLISEFLRKNAFNGPQQIIVDVKDDLMQREIDQLESLFIVQGRSVQHLRFRKVEESRTPRLQFDWNPDEPVGYTRNRSSIGKIVQAVIENWREEIEAKIAAGSAAMISVPMNYVSRLGRGAGQEGATRHNFTAMMPEEIRVGQEDWRLDTESFRRDLPFIVRGIDVIYRSPSGSEQRQVHLTYSGIVDETSTVVYFHVAQMSLVDLKSQYDAIKALATFFDQPPGTTLERTPTIEAVFTDPTFATFLKGKEKQLTFAGDSSKGYRLIGRETAASKDAVAFLNNMLRINKLYQSLLPQVNSINEDPQGKFTAQLLDPRENKGHLLVRFSDRNDDSTNITYMVDKGFRVLSRTVKGQAVLFASDDIEDVGSGLVTMGPSVNRIQGGKFMRDGQQRDINDVIGVTREGLSDEKNPIHGVMRVSNAWDSIKIGTDGDGIFIEGSFELKKHDPKLAEAHGNGTIVERYTLIGDELISKRTTAGEKGAIIDEAKHPFQLYTPGETTLEADVLGQFKIADEKTKMVTGAILPVPENFNFAKPGGALVTSDLDHTFTIRPDSQGNIKVVMKDQKRKITSTMIMNRSSSLDQAPRTKALVHLWGGNKAKYNGVGAFGEDVDVTVNGPNRQEEEGGSVPFQEGEVRTSIMRWKVEVNAAMMNEEVLHIGGAIEALLSAYHHLVNAKIEHEAYSVAPIEMQIELIRGSLARFSKYPVQGDLLRKLDGLDLVNPVSKENYETDWYPLIEQLATEAPSAAMEHTEGGIDLNAKNMAMQVSGDKLDIKFDPAMIAQFKRGDFSGIRPVIINITPIASVFPLLGLKEPEESERLAKV